MNIVEWKFCPFCGGDQIAVVGNHASCSSCAKGVYENVATTTSIAFYTPEGEIVLCERAREPYKDLYDLPGGYMDPYENGIDTITREVKEELDFTLVEENIELLLTAHGEYPIAGGSVTHFLDLSFVYPITRDDFTHMKAQDDVASIKLVDLSKIVEKDLAWEHDLLTIEKLKEYIEKPL